MRTLIFGIALATLILFSSNVFGESFEKELVAAAIERTTHAISYDGRYFSMSYPGGDVPDNIGVCTDVIIRSYRGIDTDLQKLIHEDMLIGFDSYPSKRIWGLSKTDKNIDHRRVPNLQVFFSRHGVELPITLSADNYAAGDLVTWMLPGHLPHIGIVSDQLNEKTGIPLIVHNIGSGPKLEDMLFKYKITGHYRYVPEKYKVLTD